MRSKSFGTKAPVLPHLIAGSGGMSGEIKDLRSDIEEAFTSVETLDAPTGTGPLVAEEFTNPALKVTNRHMTTVAFGTTAKVINTTALGLTGVTDSPPRNVVVGVTIATTGGTGNITVKGLDRDGNVLSEVFAIPGTSADVVGNKAFAKVTEVDIPAHGGLFAGSVIVGNGDKIGLTKTAKLRTGAVNVLKELMDGSAPTAGTFVVPATGLPHGTYAPNTAPNGTHDYFIMYERDMTV